MYISVLYGYTVCYIPEIFMHFTVTADTSRLFLKNITPFIIKKKVKTQTCYINLYPSTPSTCRTHPVMTGEG